jgi:hypothetical protein
MTGINITVEATNFENVHKSLHNLAEQISHPNEQIMRRLGETAMEDIEKRFMTRGYGTWPPLAPSTIKKKKDDFVLIETGAMFSSTKIEFGQPGQVTVSVPYGGKKHDPNVPKYQQLGTKRIPQRKIIDASPKLKAALVNTLVKWVDDMVKAFAHSME